MSTVDCIVFVFITELVYRDCRFEAFSWNSSRSEAAIIERKGNLKKVSDKQRFWKLGSRTRDIDEVVSEETAAKRALLRKQRVKRKKFAMLLAYSGNGYFGFQRNVGLKTVEGDLMEALLKAGYINGEIFNNTRLIHFTRASRTDKGVSAVGQVVSMKLPTNSSSDIINECLPLNIRALGLIKVTRGFHSRRHSDARTYSYTLPTFSFATSSLDTSHTFRLSAQLRQHINAILCLFQGSHSFHNFTSKKFLLDSTAFRTIIDFICEEPFIEDGLEFVTLKIKGVSFMMHQIRKMIALTVATVRGKASSETVVRSMERTVMYIPLVPSTGLLLEKLMSFGTWAIYFVQARERTCEAEQITVLSFPSNVEWNGNTYLFIYDSLQVHFEHYNERYGNDGTHAILNWSKWEEEVESFRKKFISPTIINAEKINNSYPFLQ